MLMTVSQKVGKNRSPISSETGLRVLSEMPKSPCSTLPT
jgi:hypothetical protein